jgi:cytochrome bd ubiquinol oxidase subunit II
MALEVVWFLLLALILTAYVVLDGFDLGVGALHLFVGRREVERRVALRSIGPVWDGNEVFLVAGGATLLLAYPVLYARAFSGFYLPLMVTLWLLAFRALAIELRHHVDGPVWKPFWDVAFAVSSTLLALVLGAALGNVVRGVSLDERGQFFAALWTHFGVGSPTGILDWYTTAVGVTALLVLALHGSNWLSARVDGEVRARSTRYARGLWWLSGLAIAGCTVATFAVQPLVLQSLEERPWSVVFPLLTVASFFAIGLFRRRNEPWRAFFASSGLLVGLLASAAATLFPYVLPGRGETAGLTVYDVAAGPTGLSRALYWWIPGMLLASVYVYYVYSRLPKLISVDDDDEH